MMGIFAHKTDRRLGGGGDILDTHWEIYLVGDPRNFYYSHRDTSFIVSKVEN